MRSLVKWLLPASLQRHLCSWRHKSDRAQFPRRQIQRTYGDFAPTVELVDRKGEQWYDRDRPFEPEIEALRQHGLRPGARVFDLGAHQGVVALALAHIVGETGSVIACEAMPFDAAAAQRNQQLNGLNQLQVIHSAIAAEPGKVEFIESGRAAYGDPTQPTIRVNSTTADHLAREYGTPDVLFLDVDGFEVEVLRGAAMVLNSKPDCYIEVHSELLTRYGQRSEEVLGFFFERDYDLLVSHEMKESQRRFVPLDRSRHDFTRGFHLLALAKD